MAGGSVWCRLRGKVARFRPAEMLTLAKVLGIITLLPILQRVMTLPGLLRLLDSRRAAGSDEGEPRRAGAAGRSADDLEPAIRWTRRVLRWRRGPFRPNCMRRSLVLFHLMRSRGVEVSVRFGVTREHGKLASHCWLERDGEPLLEKNDPRKKFHVICSFPEQHELRARRRARPPSCKASISGGEIA